MATSITESKNSGVFTRPALHPIDRIAYTLHPPCVRFIPKVAFIPISVSLLRQKKRQLLSVHSFSRQESCHTQLPPLPPLLPPQLWGCIIWEPSIARAFQDGVHLLCCHASMTRVHHRFQRPLGHRPLRSQTRVNMPQLSLTIPKKTYFSPHLPRASSPFQSYPLQLLQEFKTSEQFNVSRTTIMHLGTNRVISASTN
jgi:hypothetical protein